VSQVEIFRYWYVRKDSPKMPFVVTGTGKRGLVQHECPDAKTGVETALRLMGEGCSGVVLTAPNGRVYRSPEFTQLLNERGKFDAPGTT
jgi:hypothetical protein